MLKNQCFFVQNFRKDADALLKTCLLYTSDALLKTC